MTKGDSLKHYRLRTTLRPIRLAITVITGLALCVVPAAASAAAVMQSSGEDRAFGAAAQEFNVPKELLMAVSYNLSRWESHDGRMSVDGGFGPMNLRTKVALEDARGDARRPITDQATTKGDFTLDKAAELLRTSKDGLKSDTVQNIRGGAAVLADQAKQLNNGALPASLEDWYGAVAKYSGSQTTADAERFADDVYGTIQRGVSATTTKGQSLTIAATGHAIQPDKNRLGQLGLRENRAFHRDTNRTECPRTLTCRYIPAAYVANSPTDPTDYGNYDHSNRPHDMKVQYIIIHDTEGSYNSAISWFQSPESYVSAHYVIRSSDGEVTQMVDTQDTAWHAGDWYLNMHSIGIEHEGEAAAGASWYTEAMYRSSAELVRYLSKKYRIPLDRDHIIGHDNVPGLTDRRVPTMHWDPGPYWDWNHYMDLIKGGPDKPTPSMPNGSIVTINPTFATNIQTVKNCVGTVCTDLTAPSNFVYLRVEPRSDAALVTDPLLHPDGSPGTNRIDDWTANAHAGAQYAYAGRQGDWTAIWFAGQKAWFYNPATRPTATIGHGRTLQLRPGLAETNVYGGAYPEQSAYPASVPGPAQPKLSYKIQAGQKYVSYGTVPTDYFYDATVDYSKPYDHVVFRGQDRYLKIWYNHRIMYVKANDVIVR